MDKKKIFLGGVGLFFLICAILGGLVYYKLEVEYPDNEFSVGIGFAYAMQSGNVSRAKQFTDLTLWHRIDGWTAIHQPVSCPFTLDLFSLTDMGVGGPNAWSIFHRCPPYEIHIKGMRFGTKDSRLQIVNWERICDQDDICETE